MKGRLAPIGEWGDRAGYARARFQPAQADFPPPPTPESVEPPWRVLLADERARRAQPLDIVFGRDARRVMHRWRYNRGLTKDFYLVSAADELLVNDPRWADDFAGKCFLVALDGRGGATLDLSAYPESPPIDAPCLEIGSSPNWGHWLADLVGKLWLREKIPDLADRRLVFGALEPFHRETLDILGLAGHPAESNDAEDAGRQWRFADLAVAQAPPPALAYAFVQERLVAPLAADPTQPKRVYLTRRRQHPCHRVANEDEVAELFARRGFAVLEPEGWGLRETVARLKGAEIVAAPIGGSLGNFLLAGPDTVFIHLLPDYLSGAIEINHVLAYWVGYYLPLAERMVTAWGRFDTPEQEDYCRRHALSIINRPYRFPPPVLDQAIMSAEKILAWRRRSRA
jgi:hypothetical protein